MLEIKTYLSGIRVPKEGLTIPVTAAVNRDQKLKIHGHNPRQTQASILVRANPMILGFRISRVEGQFEGLEISDEVIYDGPFNSLTANTSIPDSISLHNYDNPTEIVAIAGYPAEIVRDCLAKQIANRLGYKT
jgi:hypothetical protein